MASLAPVLLPPAAVEPRFLLGDSGGGAHASSLAGREGRLVADFDDCHIDARRIRTPQDWRWLIDAGRIGDVRGAFAIAWLDDAGALHLARDALGERTLYLSQADGRLAFASDLRALVAPAGAALDVVSVARFLCYAYLPGAPTLVRGVRELRPGEHLTFAGGRASSERLWRLPAAASTAGEGALRGRLREALERAVRRRLPDAPEVGATLSGGIDSSLVVALAAAAGARVTAYSIAFGDEHRNELAWSAMVARHCGCEHRVVLLSPAEVMARFDATVACLAKPNGDPLTVPNHALFEAASARHGVMLNGEGGDPCFGGPKNQAMLLGEVFGAGLYAPPDALVRERAYLRAHARCYDDLADALTPAVRNTLADAPLERELTPWLDDPRQPSFVNRLMATNVTFKGAHHILPKVDALSRAFGVLPRSPLFDRDVVELAFEIPARLKIRGTVEKHLLKESVRDLLPASIIERPKSGMLVPVERWFRGPLRGFARERLLDGLAPRGIVRRDYLEALLAFRRRGLHPRIGIKLWLLLTLESWLAAYLPDARL